MAATDGFDFKLMGELLQAWRGRLQDIESLAGDFKYIRIGGKGYRPVSIHRDNPCGSLLDSASGKPVLEFKVEIDQEASSQLQNAINAGMCVQAPDAYGPGNGKPEHTVQAGLIHHALTHDLRLDGRLQGFEGVFDELVFVSDESRLDADGSVRADILALGIKNDVCFPVFVELKATRALTKVAGQLANAYEKAAENKESFVKMLSLAAKVAEEKIRFEEYKLLVIWPGSESGKTQDNYASLTKDQDRYLIGQFEYFENKQGQERKDALFNAIVTLQPRKTSNAS